jgi:hypothetical protein
MHTAVLLIDIADLEGRIFGDPGLHQLIGPIGRAVIDDEPFKAKTILGLQGRISPGQCVGPIVGRREYR